MQADLQVAGNRANKALDTEVHQRVPLVSMKQVVKTPTVPEKVKFAPDDREKKIIAAGYTKLGLKKAQDVISMALVRLAETEGLELKAS